MNSSMIVRLVLVALALGVARAQTTCSLTVGSKSSTFDNCVELNDYMMLYYTLEATATGSMFVGGLKSTTNTAGFTAFGWSPTGKMGPSDTVVVTATSADGYKIASKDPIVVRAAKGTFPLTDTAAAADGDSLVAFFSAELPLLPAALPTTYIFAVNGSLNDAGELAGHAKGMAGSGTLVLKASGAAAPVPAPAPTPSSAVSTYFMAAIAAPVMVALAALF